MVQQENHKSSPNIFKNEKIWGKMLLFGPQEGIESKWEWGRGGIYQATRLFLELNKIFGRIHLCLIEIRRRQYRRFYRVTFPKTSISTDLQMVMKT